VVGDTPFRGVNFFNLLGSLCDFGFSPVETFLLALGSEIENLLDEAHFELESEDSV
jgi:hypothetical protein